MTVSVKVNGLKELGKNLQALDKTVRNKISAKAMRAGGRIVRDTARAKAPVLQENVPHRRKGTLKKSIVERTKVGKNGKTTTLISVRALSSKRIAAFKTKKGKSGAYNPHDPYYWRFVEFGTSKMPAKPFLRPAFEQSKGQAAKAIISTLRREIMENS
ncbi:HK97-gp10 family putative phage morphogenesis protein [Frederiksenia canicola]|uniref:HK97 gp10 family phage protein n=1 Tax=Frederiksenia canicola TaxID=123824 RepID=A0AAE7C2N7_9PAST|nr:HK97-gp10 family putative phage morphogenesis protein [Frederiksenia canicola]QIM65264.1 hypothetical protein A4G17_07340 [Frederiksenia canicola]RPE96306.1 HK97 gp10 family phage protein [Frederiksenia canicola]